jgi:hypothetical protein
MMTGVEKIHLVDGSASVTEAILRPESIAAIPSYLLRFVPFVGSAPVLIATALRQAYYRSSNPSRRHAAPEARRAERSGASEERNDDNLYPREGDAVSLDVASLLHMLGNVISRAKFFRIFKDGKMDWFVTRAEAEHTFKDGHIQRLSNTYHYRGLLLTPGDASDLYTWLCKNEFSKNPVEVLTLALQTSRDKILQFPFRTLAEDESLSIPQASSVQDVVRFALGERRVNTTLSSLCDALAMHLIRPGSFLSIPWYWYHKVLPQLGDDLGVLYLMCKSCCYVDWAHGHDRNSFWVPGGLSTLQKWIGSETLPKRIPQKTPSQRGRPRSHNVQDNSEYVRSWREDTRNLAGRYLCRVGTRNSEDGQDWLIEVYEPQLTDEDEQVKDAIYSFLETHVNNAEVSDLPALLNDSKAVTLLHKAAHASENELICHYETLVNKGICHFDTLDADLIGHFDTLVTTLLSHFETLVRDELCHFDTVINILTRLRYTNLIKNYSQPPHTDADQLESETENAVVGGYFGIENWDYDQLLARVNPVLAEKVMSSVNPRAFVSWLILGALTPQIKTPLSFAVSKAIESKVDAGGAAMRLAGQPPAVMCKQVHDLNQRMSAGYLGNNLARSSVSVDLREFLDAEESQAEKLRLISRLMDVLGIMRSAPYGVRVPHTGYEACRAADSGKRMISRRP